MNYAKAILGKGLTDLLYSDLESFFAFEKEESDQIEFKSYVSAGSIDSKLLALTKSIAALLNSNGGLLIWGAPVGEKKSVDDITIKAFKGKLTDLPIEINDKDWLINKVVDKIIPLPIGIRLQVISQNNHLIAVFEVDKSPYSPHQADEKYYMRLDGQTRAAPHHYVEALFNKISYPRLEAYFKLRKILNNQGEIVVQAGLFFTNLSLENEEAFNAEIVVLGGYFTNGKSVAYYNHEGCLYYGQWSEYNFMLNFPITELSANSFISKLFVFFGGKKAPRKVCEYHLRLNNISYNKPQENVMIEMENKLQHEIIAEKNVSLEDVLNQMGIIRNFK